MQLQLRALTEADIPAWARLLAAAEAVDNTGEHYNEADLVEELANPDIEVGKDVVGAFDTDVSSAEPVGYFAVYPRGEAEGHFKVHTEGVVHPGRRSEGIGSALVAAMLDRARAAHHERHPDLPGKIMLSGLSANTAQEELLSGAGLEPERWEFVMRVDLSGLGAPAPLPAGYRLRQYDASLAEPMRQAHNTAFLDHPNFTPWTEVMWKQWVTESRNFRPDISLLVSPDESDDIVAYVQSNEFDAFFAATGRREAYVAKVGTLREHRGKGIAAALLQQCLAAYREAGYDEASLNVDSENPTGALGVYERAGFAVESRWTSYAMMTPPR